MSLDPVLQQISEASLRGGQSSHVTASCQPKQVRGVNSDQILSTSHDLQPQQAKIEPGIKFDAGKKRFDLFYPPFLDEVHAVLVFGEKKYGYWNWLKGMSQSRLFNAALRHLWAWWWMREDKDDETGLHHLAHCACCLMFAFGLEAMKRGTDDRPSIEG